MCVTNVYVDRYPDGREVEFRQTSICQYGQPGKPCANLSILENPVRNIQFNEPTTQFILTQPIFPSTPPRTSGGSHHRQSVEDNSLEEGHRRRKLPILKSTPTHKKERIVVDSSPTPRTLPQSYDQTFTAPSSPIIPPRTIDERRPRPGIVDERPLRAARAPSVDAVSPRSMSHTAFDFRAELAYRERRRRALELEAEHEDTRRRQERINELDDEIRRRSAVPVSPASIRQRSSFQLGIDRSNIGELKSDDRLGEKELEKRCLDERDRNMRRRLEEEEEEAMRQRLRERQIPRRAEPAPRRRRLLYNEGIYGWEDGSPESNKSATSTFAPSTEDITFAAPMEPPEGDSVTDPDNTVATPNREVFQPIAAQPRIEDPRPTQGRRGAEGQSSNSPVEMDKDLADTFSHELESTMLPGFIDVGHHGPSRSSSSDSLQSIVDSIFSIETFSSVSTAPGPENAFQRVLAILRADASMKELYNELTVKTSPGKFTRNFGTLIKRFAVDLEKEATCWNEQRAAQFICSRARKIAQKISQATFPLDTESSTAQTILVEHNEAENSESSDLDEETNEFQELEKFITNSKAFRLLRLNVQRFLGAEPDPHDDTLMAGDCDLFSLLPFADSPSDGLVGLKQDRSCSRWKVLYPDSFWKSVIGLFVSEPPIPDGMARVSWKCACGESLYDDYFELREDAAKRMENFLRRAFHKIRTQKSGSIVARAGNLGGAIKGSVVSLKHRIQSMNRSREEGLAATELRYYSEARATRTPAHTSEDALYLLLCHNDGIGAEIVKLRQPDICDINNDNKLFGFLYEEYTLLRKRWWSWISLWTLQSIKFVRFELHENALVDIKKLDEVPPPTKNNDYRHGPPNPPELNPPLGPTLLMHLFKHPELAGTRKHCLKKFPRKLRDRLALFDEGDSTGWGLQFIEGWSKKRLMYMAALTFGLSSVIVMILISVMGHNIQNAAAISSFMLSFVTIGIATLQAALHMS